MPAQEIVRMLSFTMLTSAVKQRRVPKDKDGRRLESSPTNPEAKEACQFLLQSLAKSASAFSHSRKSPRTVFLQALSLPELS